MKNLIFILSTSLIVFVGCQTSLDRIYKTSDLKEGEWTAKVMVRDKVKKSNNYLNIDFIAIRPHRLRFDVVTTSLGIHLATFVMNQKKTRYLLAREKKFFIGPTGPEMMKTLVRVPLNPRVFSSFLFDVPPEQDQWTCKFDKNQFLKECKSLLEPLEIVWKKRSPNQRVIAVRSLKADITLHLRLIQPKVQNKRVAFHLSPPEGYKIFRFK